MPANPASKYLSERLISRLSPLRRNNLMRQVREHAQDWDTSYEAGVLAEGACVGAIDGDRYKANADRSAAMLGRLAALT